jgi:hypothetical protein
MPEKFKTAIEAWKAADSRCRLAEQELSTAMEAFMQQKQPEVPADLIARVATLRAEAAARLRESIDEMRAAAELNGHRATDS